MSAGGADGETAEGEGYGADQQSEDDQINEMMAGSDAELQVCVYIHSAIYVMWYFSITVSAMLTYF